MHCNDALFFNEQDYLIQDNKKTEMVRIRKAKVNDSYKIAEIIIECWNKAYKDIVPEEILRKMDIREREKHIRNYMEGTYVLEVNKRICGFIIIGYFRDSKESHDLGEIWGLYISPEDWKKGYGKRLVIYGEKLLKNRGCKKALLWVLKENHSSRSFYENQGYKTGGRIKAIEDLGNTKVIRYYKDLL